ncbi:MAG: hypothetical protein ACRD0K_00600 [Egibacteraceae bacterium]
MRCTVTNEEFPTLRRGDAIVLTGALLRAAAPRTTDQFRLVLEVTSINGQPVQTPGRCSELKLIRPNAALTALEVGDTLEVRGTISAAGSPKTTKTFGDAQSATISGLSLNGSRAAAGSASRLWLARPGEPSRLDRLEAERTARRPTPHKPRPAVFAGPQRPASPTSEDLTLSTFLRNPTAVLAQVDRGDVVLRRRDARALRLSLEGRSRDRDAGTALVARMLAVLAEEDTGRAAVARALQRSLAWTDMLPRQARDEFVAEFLRTVEACAEIGAPAPLMQLLRQWQETAAIYADPELARTLTSPLPGDAGAVPEPAPAQLPAYAQER